MCKKVLLITNCDQKRSKEHERALKAIYLSKNPKCAILFAHKGTKPHEVVNILKSKKVSLLVFEEDVRACDIENFLGAIKKVPETKRPELLHVNKTQLFKDVTPVEQIDVQLKLAA